MKRKSIYRVLSTVLIIAITAMCMSTLSLAAVGNTSTESQLRSRVSASGTGDVVLSANIGAITSQLTISRNLTIDLNGHTLTIDVGNTNGISISSGCTLTVRDSFGDGRLHVTNRSSSTASGIGAAIYVSAGALIIESGTVTVTGGSYGAGIGGGSGHGGGVITINGGTVNATGGTYGAGIGGGGNYGPGGKITINGGTVNATCGSGNGAGIGGGSGGAGGEIYINRGTVNATGGKGGGAGIGGGLQGAGGRIIVRGGTITAIASSSGNSVAVGHGSSGDTGTFGIEGRYECWMNAEAAEPTETAGKTETFPIGYLYPYNYSFKYMKFVSLHPGDNEDPIYYGDVQAKIIDKDKVFIDVSIEWGEMKFVHDTAERKWDSKNHVYIERSGEASWLVSNAEEHGENATEWYLEHGNNKVAVTNHSNVAVDVEFKYTMLTGTEVDPKIAGSATAFNVNENGNNKNAVIGGFYISEEGAKDAALILTDPTGNTSFNTLPNSKISLYTAVGRSLDNTDIAGSVYFAFSGTPDAGRSAVLPNFKKVGTITVTISKNDDIFLNTPGDD